MENINEWLLEDKIDKTCDKQHITRKIHIILFFLMGFGCVLPGRILDSCFFLLTLYYLINATFFEKNKQLRNGFIFFLVIALILLAHLALTNLYEIMRFSYIPFHSLYLNSGIKTTLRMIFTLVYVYAVSIIFRKYSQDGLLIKSFIGGLNVFLIIAICYLPYFIKYAYGNDRLSISFQEDGIFIHPNTIGYIMMLAFYMNLLAFFYTKRTILKLYNGIFCSINLLTIIATMSRTSLASLLLGLCCAIFFHRKLFLSLVITLLLCGVYAQTSESNFSSYFPLPERFTFHKAIEDKASGRTMVWSDYLSYATLKDYLLGVGYGGYAEMILYQKPIQMVNNRAPTTLGVFHTHNTYLEVLLMFGVVGFCLYIYFLIFIFRKIFNNVISESGVSKIYFSMYVSFLIWGIFEKMHKFSWLFIIIFLSQAITSEID